LADAVPFTSGQEAATEALAHRSMAVRVNVRDDDREGRTAQMMVACAFRQSRGPSQVVWLVTAGNETDFDEIKIDVRQLCSWFNLLSAGYDPWQSAQMAQGLRAEGVPVHKFRAPTQNFSPAMIELDAAMRAGQLRQADSNVVGKADRRGNLYPTKSRRDQIIDAAVALMMAIGRAMVQDEEAKGLDGFLANPIFG
jgi:phage terminase large subunit-like protein